MPPAPLQTTWYEDVPWLFSVPVETLPEVWPFGWKPVPVQVVAPLEFQLIVADCPCAITDGEMERVAVGGGF